MWLVTEEEIYNLDGKNGRINLNSPTLLPKASTFLWNRKMLIQMNCRGYANAQFMQPEPNKYSRAPNIEEKTFMQPEPNYYAHHPGRFFYVKDECTGELFSAPYEPTRTPLDIFQFSAGLSDVQWNIVKNDVEFKLKLTLAKDDSIELWSFEVINRSAIRKKLSIYPYFSIGYMSWMNQSAGYVSELNGIVASSVSPYQKLEDYYKQKSFKDRTFLLSNKPISSFSANQALFEGEGGLANPSQIMEEHLSCSESQYEVPTAVFQHRINLQENETYKNQLIFGPAKSIDEIERIRAQYFGKLNSNLPVTDSLPVEQASDDYQQYIEQAQGCLKIDTPDKEFDHFVNFWLPRQLHYHGEVNRLTNDPQTRNYLQDNMGMSYISPSVARASLIESISQQLSSGAMPDGVLIHHSAELKYINQIPHTDHSVWLPICLSAYLDETNDYDLLLEEVGYADDTRTSSLANHIDEAMEWLINNRDHRGLSLIAQGDWCDPMNMVGHKGKGVSSWLTMATSYALKIWSNICDQSKRLKQAEYFQLIHREINERVNQYFWHKDWYARGITDDGHLFGIDSDLEGSIFLNPQSWAILCNAMDDRKISKMLLEITQRLDTPYGPMMLSPAYTQMREDVGRLTQKSPGVSENGSVYNHAAIFYAFSLYHSKHKQKAFDVLRKMLPSQQDAIKRGQLPNYIPNYYRGAIHQFPEQAGRSSQLFNTGTVSWYYRCLIDGLFGLKGKQGKLEINPHLPEEWENASVIRQFMGATFKVSYHQSTNFKCLQIYLDGNLLDSNVIKDINTGRVYSLKINCPIVVEHSKINSDPNVLHP